MIYFSDDPAFKGSKRELTAADYVYAWKRLIDPKLRSNNVQIFDDRLVGAKDAIGAAIKAGKFDYDAPLEGAQALAPGREIAGRREDPRSTKPFAFPGQQILR